MSYLVLARKYRPRRFDQLVGQEHVVRALTHALEQQRLHHAYLFTGTRGVGKTTLSRILAKALNCMGADGQGGITATPCGVCEACTAIDAGRFVDYVEMDAASNRGVEEMTSLLDKAVYAPSAARFKVYMIDEVHMLSNHAFNAMLKTLEEPPPHLKFILATTDPQKVPVTVLSRCLQFNLKQMPPAHIVEHLAQILPEENVGFEPNALRLLAQAAQGSMRDALSLTGQAIAYAAGQVTEASVRAMLGAVDTGYVIQLLEALQAEDAARVLALAEQMATQSLSLSTALQELALLLQRIALTQKVPDALPDDLPEADSIRRLAQQFDPEEVQLHYQIALTGRQDLPLAPDEWAGFTMTLLRMLAFRPTRLSTAAATTQTAATSVALNALRKPAPLLAPRNVSTVVAPKVETELDFNGDWTVLVDELDIKGLARELARQSELIRYENKTFYLRVANTALTQAAQLDKLAEALSQRLGVVVKVRTELGGVHQTVAARDDASARQRQQEAEQAFMNAPVVKTLIEKYGAKVVPGSIKPMESPS
ncbi:MAG: DNA polymerase III subunit gamma/tau [Burkholderiales bacterium]|nr:DNA polymerase III subunit gamma/tau [Burkholderiales bacterium]